MGIYMGTRDFSKKKKNPEYVLSEQTYIGMRIKLMRKDGLRYAKLLLGSECVVSLQRGKTPRLHKVSVFIDTAHYLVCIQSYPNTQWHLLYVYFTYAKGYWKISWHQFLYSSSFFATPLFIHEIIS